MRVANSDTLLLALTACGGLASAPIRAGDQEFVVKEDEAQRALKLDRTARTDPAQVCRFFRTTLSEGAERGKLSDQFAAWMKARSAMICAGGGDGEVQGRCGASFPPRRRYVTSEVMAVRAADPSVDWVDANDFTDSLDEARGGPLKELPANTAVDWTRVLRNSRIEPDGDGCNFAAVTIVDAGGVASAGSRYVVPLSALSEAAGGEAPSVALKRAADERRAATARVFKEEAETGRCSADHVDYLRKVLSGTKGAFDGMGSGSYPQFFNGVGHEILVASGTATPVEFNAGIGGELHVFAFQFSRDLRIEVLDKDRYAVTQDSPYRSLLTRMFELPSQSRVLQANAGERITVNVTGYGCTLVLALNRL